MRRIRFPGFTVRFWLMLSVVAAVPLAWYGNARQAWLREQAVIRQLALARPQPIPGTVLNGQIVLFH